MTTTNFDRHTSGECAPAPLAVRLSEAERITSFSRSELYRRAGLGQINLMKCGRRTLVDFKSLRRLVASLPRAVIKPRVAGPRISPATGNHVRQLQATLSN